MEVAEENKGAKGNEAQGNMQLLKLELSLDPGKNML